MTDATSISSSPKYHEEDVSRIRKTFSQYENWEDLKLLIESIDALKRVECSNMVYCSTTGEYIPRCKVTTDDDVERARRWTYENMRREAKFHLGVDMPDRKPKSEAYTVIKVGPFAVEIPSRCVAAASPAEFPPLCPEPPLPDQTQTAADHRPPPALPDPPPDPPARAPGPATIDAQRHAAERRARYYLHLADEHGPRPVIRHLCAVIDQLRQQASDAPATPEQEKDPGPQA